jgi:hypothetical protein
LKANMPNDAAPQDHTVMLARLLYVHLAGKALTVTETSAKLATGADNLAKLSFTLAEAFVKHDTARRVAAGPRSEGIDVSTLDFDNIMGKI